MKTTYKKSILLSFSGIFLLALLLNSCGIQNRKALRDHGITTEATLVKKYVSANTRFNDRHQFFDMSFFAEQKAGDSGIQVLADTSMSMLDRLDHWKPGADIGKFSHVQIEVRMPTFTKYEAGDKIKIVYLPESPDIAMLAEELSDD